MTTMSKQFLVGVAVGSGLAARAAQSGGADFLLAINAGRMRNMGAPSVAGNLPIMDAMALTEAFASSEVLSQVSIPVYLGVNVFGASADAAEIAQRAVEQGFDGVVNFPSSIHYPASLQHILERGGRGIAQEVAVLTEAKNRGLKTVFYCSNRTQARFAADAQLDSIVLNFGWNSGGAMGHKQRLSLEEVTLQARDIGRFVRRLHPSIKFMLEGGPIVTADDLAVVAEKADFDGYVGGSTIERLPLESAVVDLIASYRSAGAARSTISPAQRRLLAWGRDCGVVGKSAATVSCLQKLNTLVKLHVPVMIRHEQGADLDWIITAFERHVLRQQARELPSGEQFMQVVRPGIEDRHGSASRRIFGTLKDEQRNRGALGSDSCQLLLVHEPESLPPRTQMRLARALREGWYYAPGTRERVAVIPRCVFICQLWVPGQLPDTLHDDLAQLLEPSMLDVPPLRQRPDDIAALIGSRLSRLGVTQQPQLSSSALLHLQTLEWTANERALYTLADELAQLQGEIDKRQIETVLLKKQPDDADDLMVARGEKARVVETLWRHNFHRGRTARALGMSRKTLYNKMRRYGLGL